jgi:hypothetical protein
MADPTVIIETCRGLNFSRLIKKLPMAIPRDPAKTGGTPALLAKNYPPVTSFFHRARKELAKVE